MITEVELARVRFVRPGWVTDPLPRDRADHFGRTHAGDYGWALEHVDSCACCGRPSASHHVSHMESSRCLKHLDRNPCAIEGCHRTNAAPVTPSGPYLSNSEYLCPDHWRRYVPPRSLLRRAYFRHLRIGTSRDRFSRFWDSLVVVARRRASHGRIDQAAIAAMFGWDAADA